jgi:DNA topoisomerase-1
MARAASGRRRRRAASLADAENPLVAAKLAGLRYVHDSMPGIRRKCAGKGFTYIGPDGRVIRDKAELARIKKLGIPPAWTEVWVCPSARGHIQATGRDAKGRKQYRYHDLWRCIRDETKFHRMIAFARALPHIRARLNADLGQRGLSRERVLATVVRLLDETLIRVGNEEYARKNESYGLTTMHNEHVDVEGTSLRFRFRGKSGKEHEVELRDKRVARIVSRLQDLPGEELFQYVDDAGEVRSIGSDDVNAYLHEISGEEFTAKDFRTWGGSVVAAEALKELGDFETQTQAKRNIAQAIKAAAAHLGNTPAICKKSYVHPGVLEAYLNHLMAHVGAMGRPVARPIEGLRPQESALLALLEAFAEQHASSAKAG